MFSQKKQEKLNKRHDRLKAQSASDAQLDDLARELVNAARLSDAEIKETVSAPFLYARIRARITAEQGRLEAREVVNNWRAMLQTAWQPLAGMAVIAFAAVMFWLTAMPGVASNNIVLNGTDSLIASEPGFERIVFSDGDTLSNDEMLTIIVNHDETEVQR